eukprot:gene6968-11134_t
MPLKSTDVKNISKIVQKTRDAFNRGGSISYESRIRNLKQLQKFLKENEKELREVLFKDLHLGEFACQVELSEPYSIAENAIENLSSWMKPETRSVPLLQKPASATIEKEPFGVVCIIAPWNFPIGLLFKPLVGAIAAGNAVIVKPSEVTENCSNFFADNFKKYFPSDEFEIVTGGVTETSELLKEQFDYIFYTGSTVVGKIIMKAAAEHLTPVTLELGGKCPVYFDKDVDFEVACSRISWGKWFNAGQACVSPDYILCHKSKKEEFLKTMASRITQFYGEDPSKSEDLAHIVSKRHMKRLESLLENQKIYHGGKNINYDTLYFEPTIVDSPDKNSKLMQEEIFGPILPVIAVDGIDEAIQFIKDMKDKPLASYIFSSNSENQKKFISKVTSGGAGVNEAVMHVACEDLPFGGVGKSGLGRGYNGKSTFDIFTHEKSVLNKATWMDSGLRYPPYTPGNVKILKFLQNFKIGDYLLYLILSLVVIIAIVYKLRN